MLRIRAGRIAWQRLMDEGLAPSAVRLVLGASGGPKWLVLAALDEVIFGEWLPTARQDIDLIGSSIGAWRMAAACHPTPGPVLRRMQRDYLLYRHDRKDTIAGITRRTEETLHRWLSAQDQQRIVTNPGRRLHVVASRGKGLMARNRSLLVALGLAAAAVGVLAHRDAIGVFFQRAVFSHAGVLPLAGQWRPFETLTLALTVDNLAAAMLASSAVPGITAPQRDIAAAPPGLYWDGGFIDYHFDSPFRPDDGLVLYPHFYPDLVPGWFDKARGRKTPSRSLDHTVILCPTAEFVGGLPGGKIPDRQDFQRLDNDRRIDRWQRVIVAGRALRDAFDRLADNHKLLQAGLERI